MTTSSAAEKLRKPDDETEMSRMDIWWWLSIPYSVVFPLFVLVFRLQESIGHAATLFLLISFLTTFSSAVWMLVTIYQLATSPKSGLTWRTKIKLVLVLVAALLWIVLLVGPE